MTLSILTLSYIRVEIYIEADIVERFSGNSFEDAIKFVEGIASSVYGPLDSLESFVSITYNDGFKVSYSMYSLESLVLLLGFFSLINNSAKCNKKKRKNKNGKKKS